MRWKIKSIDTKIDKEKGQKITTETKQLMISVGDAVGVGKNAIGAVQAAMKTLPKLAAQFPNADIKRLIPDLSILSTVIKGLDIYKNIAKVIEKITPVSQIIARASGTWASPGNVGDIAQIVLGQVQKVLISIAISGILKLKEFIWNYEFSLKEVKSVFLEPMDKNMKDLLNKMPIPDPLKDLNNAGSGNEDSLLDIEGNLNGENGLGGIDWSDSVEFNDCSYGYKTEYTVNGNKRMLRGNLRNLGIQYSDDNGATWKQTEQKTGSWKNFAKIKTSNGYRYICGGIGFVKSTQTDSYVSLNKNHFYYDDVKKKYLEYSYNEKKKLTIEETGIPKDLVESLGIYYSDDNGINWKETNCKEWINDLCEFEEKVGSASTVVASSNNYKGSFYSEDGIDWKPSDVTDGRWLKVNVYNDDFKNFVFNNIETEAVINMPDVYLGNEVKSDTIYQNFTANKLIVEKNSEK